MIKFVEAKSDEQKAQSPIYLTQETHDKFETALAILKGLGKQMTGYRNTKKGMVEASAELLLDMVSKLKGAENIVADAEADNDEDESGE